MDAVSRCLRLAPVGGPWLAAEQRDLAGVTLERTRGAAAAAGWLSLPSLAGGAITPPRGPPPHDTVPEPRDSGAAEAVRRIGVVDDDESVRESLPDLLRSYGFEVEPFASASAFLASGAADTVGCLILDIAMPGMSGLELQHALTRPGRDLPIIFISARADEATRALVTERGAVALLLKPFSEQDMIQAIAAAFARRETDGGAA